MRTLSYEAICNITVYIKSRAVVEIKSHCSGDVAGGLLGIKSSLNSLTKLTYIYFLPSLSKNCGVVEGIHPSAIMKQLDCRLSWFRSGQVVNPLHRLLLTWTDICQVLPALPMLLQRELVPLFFHHVVPLKV